MTKPLTSADCDLRDFQFMSLDVVRLRDSDFTSKVSGDGFRAGVLLWCASWHQLPAASLPVDDRTLAKLAGYGFAVKEWQRLREEALTGWILCDDGRLYHPVVAEKAREAWDGKLQFQYRKECDRIRKAAARAKSDAVIPTYESWLTSRQGQSVHRTSIENPSDIQPASDGNPSEKALIGTGTGTGTGIIKDQERSASAGESVGPWNPETSEAWKAFEAHHQQTRKWSAPRRMLALGQLKTIEFEFGNPDAVLTWALSRGLSDLADCAQRMAADAAKENKNGSANSSGTGTTQAALERYKEIRARTGGTDETPID